MVIALLLIVASNPSRAGFEPLPAEVPAPAENPTTREKVALGRKLFFDRRISAGGRYSCFTCHDTLTSGDDHLALAVTPSGRVSHRNVPTVFNAAFLSTQFWYGDAATLEEQAEGPLSEMGGGDAEEVVRRVRAIPGYGREFSRAFPGAELTLKTLTQAIASYERTLITRGDAFDRFLSGETGALSASAQRGMSSFEKIGCIQCHSGPLLAGPHLPAGEGFYRKFPIHTDNVFIEKYHLSDDPGRFAATGVESDRGFWKVPQLRNIALTAPYFHNGSVATLDEAVRVMAKTQLGRDLSAADASDLVEFLKSLSGRPPRQEIPRLPPLN
ncbi:MAG: cytochrome-c peroxidase [Bdellovibrionota bacterium]